MTAHLWSSGRRSRGLHEGANKDESCDRELHAGLESPVCRESTVEHTAACGSIYSVYTITRSIQSDFNGGLGHGECYTITTSFHKCDTVLINGNFTTRRDIIDSVSVSNASSLQQICSCRPFLDSNLRRPYRKSIGHVFFSSLNTVTDRQ